MGTFNIDDPQNWVALFSLFTTSLIASRLSDRAKQRTIEAVERRQDVERLYAFSRAILLMDATEPFPKQLAVKLADIFGLTAVLLYDRSTDEIYRAGASDFEGMERQIEILTVADDEAVRLQGLIDNVVDMVRLDSTRIDVKLELSEVEAAIRELVASMYTEIEDRHIQMVFDQRLPPNGFRPAIDPARHQATHRQRHEILFARLTD